MREQLPLINYYETFFFYVHYLLWKQIFRTIFRSIYLEQKKIAFIDIILFSLSLHGFISLNFFNVKRESEKMN